MPAKSKQFIPYNEQAVKKVATTKHDAQTAYVIRDVPGLMLTCFPSGSATFSVRFTANGKRRKESIGPWGVITLADARAKALKVAAGAAEGMDVLEKEAKDNAKLTLKQLWQERAAKDTARAERTMEDYALALNRDVFPDLGNRLAAEITSDDFANVLMKIEDRAPQAAHKVRSALGSTYRWAQRRRLVKINPIVGLGFTHQSKRRKQVVTDDDMGKLWNAITDAPGLTEPMRNIIRLAIVTGQRNSEVAGMEVAELKGLDTATPRWDIPGRRMKRKGDDQHVPLSKQAVEIVRASLKLSSNGLHVFEGAPNGRREGKWRHGHIVNEAVSRAMAKVVAAAGLTNIRLHDMRKVVTSWLAEHGHATSEVLDAILHHGRKGVTGTHYNFALYERQVRAALQTWADHVEAVAAATKKDTGPAANVTELRRPAAATA